MAINYPFQGESSAAPYSISATPYVTSSTITLGEVRMIDFEYVSKFLIVRNTSPAGVIAVAFTENGFQEQNSNYFFLSGSESFSADFRTDKLFISGSEGTCNFTVIGGLTFVPGKMHTTLTGSNGFPGVG